jgi:hypothetical protein
MLSWGPPKVYEFLRSISIARSEEQIELADAK